MTRARRAKAYARRVRTWLAEHRYCAACVGVWNRLPRRAVDVHHKRGRGWRGELLNDEAYWIPVCRECHVWIHGHPEAARRLGLLAARDEWNRKL